MSDEHDEYERDEYDVESEEAMNRDLLMSEAIRRETWTKQIAERRKMTPRQMFADMAESIDREYRIVSKASDYLRSVVSQIPDSVQKEMETMTDAQILEFLREFQEKKSRVECESPAKKQGKK